MRFAIYISSVFICSLGAGISRLDAQQFQPLFLIEWGDSNGLIPVTSNFMGFDGVQVYARLDSVLAAVIAELQIGTCQDTITQAGHGFSVGDLIGQESAFGDYFNANTSDPDSLPVAAVYKVIDANRFVPCNEGFFNFTHGQANGVDYFLKDNGAVSSTPDSTYNVFAFRTFGANTAYFDIPELVITIGEAGSGSVVIDSTRLTQDSILLYYQDGTEIGRDTIRVSNAPDADWFDNTTDAPPAIMGQDIYTTGDVAMGQNLTVGLPGGGFRGERFYVELDLATTQSRQARFGSGDATDLRIYRDGAGMWIVNADGPTGTHESILFSGTSNDMYFYTAGNLRIRITELGYIVYDDAPNYANDAAADADANLPSGGIYTVTSVDRSLRIKP